LCDTDDVEVKFVVEQKVVSVTTSKVIFTIYDPVDKIILAKRVQHLMLLNFLEPTRTNVLELSNVTITNQNVREFIKSTGN
jgi:hypothetical protein